MSLLILVTLTSIVILALPTPALAQDPGGGTPDIPYDFQPIELEGGENPVAGQLVALSSDTGNINKMGSYSVSVWAMLDNFGGGGVLAFFTIILAGLFVIRFLAKFVFRKDAAAVVDDSNVYVGQRSYSRRRRRVRF